MKLLCKERKKLKEKKKKMREKLINFIKSKNKKEEKEKKRKNTKRKKLKKRKKKKLKKRRKKKLRKRRKRKRLRKRRRKRLRKRRKKKPQKRKRNPNLNLNPKAKERKINALTLPMKMIENFADTKNKKLKNLNLRLHIKNDHELPFIQIVFM